MFSIVIPTYNKGKYIHKAISSVFNQQTDVFEIIFVDDGSDDGTIDLLMNSFCNFKESIKIIQQSNSGVSTARNNGVASASFPYIAFLDADDWWHPDYLLKMKELIKKYPDAGIYGSSYFKVKSQKEIPANIGVDSTFNDGLINYFKAYSKTLWMPLTSSSTIIKKSVFDEFNGFNPQLKLGEDFYLWAHVALKYPVAFLNKPLAYYNQDVDLKTRAVGPKLYEPEEHMLFAEYSVLVKQNKDFQLLFERLALYGLMPYYAAKKNFQEVNVILHSIHWSEHELKYFVFYKLLAPTILLWWLAAMKFGSKLKRILRK